MTHSGLAGMIAMILLAAGCDRAPAPRVPDNTAATPPGEAVYYEYCGDCHNGAVYKAPHKMFLAMMAPDAILESMDGVMAIQAATLNDQQKKEVAEYLAGKSLESQTIAYPPTRCRITDISRPGVGKNRFHVDTDQGGFTASAVVLATGGLSIPKMGATGFAHDAAQRFGLKLTDTGVTC